MKWVYHASRVVFGGWWLFSGLMHFLWTELQPLGDEPASIAFTRAPNYGLATGWPPARDQA